MRPLSTRERVLALCAALMIGAASVETARRFGADLRSLEALESDVVCRQARFLSETSRKQREPSLPVAQLADVSPRLEMLGAHVGNQDGRVQVVYEGTGTTAWHVLSLLSQVDRARVLTLSLVVADSELDVSVILEQSHVP